MHKPSLRTNFAWTLIGNVIYTGAQWFLLVLLAKFTSVYEVGLFSLALAVTAPIFMLTNLHLRTIQATDTVNRYQFGHYVAVRLIMTGAACIIIFLIPFVGGYDDYSSIIIWLIGVAKGIESLSDIIYGSWQQEERMNLIALSMIIKGGTSLVAMGSIIILTGELVWGVLGLLIAWSAVTILFDVIMLWREGKRLYPSLHWPTLWALVRLSLPMGVMTMLLSLNINIPRYFLERIVGAEELGYFVAVSSLMIVGSTIIGSLGQSVVMRLARYYNLDDLQKFRQLLAQLLLIATLLGLASLFVAWAIGEAALGWLFTPDYAQFGDILISMMGVAFLGYIAAFLEHALTAMRYFKAQMGLLGITTAVLVCTCWWLIPIYHSWGAVWSLGLSLFIQIIIKAGIVSYAIRYSPIHINLPY